MKPYLRLLAAAMAVAGPIVVAIVAFLIALAFVLDVLGLVDVNVTVR